MTQTIARRAVTPAAATPRVERPWELLLGLVLVALLACLEASAPAPAKLVAVGLFWLWAAGAAIAFTLSGDREDLAPSALNSALGLAALGILSQLGVYVGLRNTLQATAACGVVAALAIIARLLLAPSPGGAHSGGAHSAGAVRVAAHTTPAAAPAPAEDEPPAAPAALRLAGGAALTAAVVLWAVSLNFLHISKVSGYGLLPALPFTFYLALAIAVVAAVLLALAPHPD
jgi:hypothetical protein